ncbi:2Fe-2S iron-sulfur cluster-binding protein [Balneolales bacterium ANBcel1]|nr:2Fe-2S iron-sulfur cluster-binding protein [Balneolales bacterium ANBcel1]
MPEIFIDNIRYEYEKPGKVLQFMLDNGMDLPFFCYHPSLSVPANCRQCIVKAGMPIFDKDKGTFETDEDGNRKIRFFPKLMTACSLDMADGMVIHSHVTDDLVKQAQADNLEFILINHPLDCPICDQAGECPLQILTYKYGPEGSRFEHKKVHKPKAIQLGPRVILDAERCINCTRCVRFTDEISKSRQLTIISRGDKNYPMTADGETFDDPYSLNTVDICPVGALTSADFRFKARVWEMNQTPGIDMTNGKGCNTYLWTRDNLVLRITPRFNEAVNDHWMPDYARLDYKKYNENRVSRPHLKLDDRDQVKTSWNNAELTFGEELDKVKGSDILVIGSAHASVEDNFAFRSFFEQKGAESFVFLPHVEPGFGDDLLISDDHAPNSNGVRALGFQEEDEKSLAKRIESTKPKIIAILEDDLLGRTGLPGQLFGESYTIIWASNHSETTRSANLVIPVTCAAEHAASYVNVDGRIQRTVPAKETLYTNRRLNLEMSMARLDHYGTKFDNWVSDDNRVDCIPAWEFFSRIPSSQQAERWKTSREIMEAISTRIPVFEGVSYDRMDDENGIQLEIKKITEANTV